MVAHILVVANDAFVGPSQDLGICVGPIRSCELLFDCCEEICSIQVLDVVAIWLETEELSDRKSVV